MLNGLYTATSGMMMQQKRMDVIASNLSNLNTIGHKKEVALFSQYLPNPTEHPNEIIRESDYNKMINSKVRLDNISVNFEQGYMRESGNRLDFALQNPNQFFAVDTPFGIRFTRDGQFSLNANNELITKQGYPVMANMEAQQPVTLRDDNVVSENGDILLDGAIVGSIELVQFDDLNKLQKVGHNMYAALDTLPDPAENPSIAQGYLEGSNVNPMEEMVKMIEASRGFESYQKIIQTFQEMDSKAVGEVGRIS